MRSLILGVGVAPTSYAASTNQILQWVYANESRTVCLANVHMIMEAWDSASYRSIINHADLVTPDGMPLVWMLRLKGQKNQERVYGPDLMLHVLEAAEQFSIPVGFYGSSSDVLNALIERMRYSFPSLKIVFFYSPPFYSVTSEEDSRITREIRESGARILFIGLGCPKQELWMAEHRGNISAVMLGVGAAFDFHAGVKRQAPSWMQSLGMEWLFRLIQEPRRLWSRYLYHNPRFVLFSMAELLGIIKNAK